MTDEEAIAKYEAMKEYFGNDLPVIEHEPLRFAYYSKVYDYYNKSIQFTRAPLGALFVT